jgi:hypothetical protein
MRDLSGSTETNAAPLSAATTGCNTASGPGAWQGKPPAVRQLIGDCNLVCAVHAPDEARTPSVVMADAVQR